MKSSRFIFLIAISIAALISPVVVVAQSNLESSYSVPTRSENISQISSEDLWDRANTAYANENYNRAEKMYREILSRGVHSAELYYNLGNTEYKRGRIGQSLLYLYKAQRLRPSDDDIQHNIDVVSLSTQDNITQMPRMFLFEWDKQISSMLNCMTWSILSLVTFALALVSLMLYLLSGALIIRRVGFAGVVFTVILFIFTTRYAIDARADVLNPDEAIVMSSSLPVTSAPNKSSTELFILHEGTKVRIDNCVEGWCEIVLDDGKKGWVASTTIERI